MAAVVGGEALAGTKIIAVLAVPWSPPHPPNSNVSAMTKALFSIVTPMN